MLWFEELMGFEETSHQQVQSTIAINGNTMTSTANNKTYTHGRLEIPSLKELKHQFDQFSFKKGQLTIAEKVADVQELHLDTTNTGAFFQAASQFNLLEMISPEKTPEDGIGIYQYDKTQGPACAIACGAGTIFRNYFVKLGHQLGQTESLQVDTLKGVGTILGNDDNKYWTIKNGYALPHDGGLELINSLLSTMSASQLETLRQALQIGIQWNTQVTLEGSQHTVTQAYCSALPVAYTGFSKEAWKPLATLVLDATYEATMYAAAINFNNTGNPRVFLTLVGGGAFGNHIRWIFEAIKKALATVKNIPLEVYIVSYGQSNFRVRQFVDGFGV